MNTAYTFLYHKTSGMSAFSKLCDITNHPDLRRVPDKMDTTTLSTDYDTSEPSLRKAPEMTYGCLYNKTDYDKIKDLENSAASYQIRFGENGQYGCVQWEGKIFFQISGGGVGDIRKGSITFYPSSDFTDIDPTIVYINPIGDKAINGTGTLTVNVVTAPENATISAVSTLTENANVTVAGHTLTITGVAAGATVITVTAAIAGLSNGTETFTVFVS